MKTSQNQSKPVRPSMRKEMWKAGKTEQVEKSFVRSAGRLWNQASRDIKRINYHGIRKTDDKNILQNITDMKQRKSRQWRRSQMQESRAR